MLKRTGEWSYVDLADTSSRVRVWLSEGGRVVQDFTRAARSMAETDVREWTGHAGNFARQSPSVPVLSEILFSEVRA